MGWDVFWDVSPSLTIYYHEGAEGWSTPTWTAPDGRVYNTVMLKAEEPEVPAQLLGDINLDGSVDISDAQLLFQYSMMPDFYPIGYKGNVDFNGDGNVDIADAQRLFQYSMMPDFYPIG